MNTKGNDAEKFMNKVYPLFIFFCVTACGLKTRSADDLNAFVQNENNGLQKSLTSEGTRISVSYKPTDLWIHQELQNSASTQEAIESLRKKYSAYHYFVVSFSRNSEEALTQLNNMREYGELVQTMSFRMDEFVSMTTSQRDTIPVGDFAINRTYGLSASTDILFAFSKEKTTGSQWIQIDLSEFGLGVGKQRFRFDIKDLEDAPLIDFKTI
jgi:hypothetical protein